MTLQTKLEIPLGEYNPEKPDLYCKIVSDMLQAEITDERVVIISDSLLHDVLTPRIEKIYDAIGYVPKLCPVDREREVGRTDYYVEFKTPEDRAFCSLTMTNMQITAEEVKNAAVSRFISTHPMHSPSPTVFALKPPYTTLGIEPCKSAGFNGIQQKGRILRKGE